MNKVKTIFANMSWMIIAQGITSVLTFIWTILSARYLGVNNYGILSAAIAFSGLFSSVADLGTMFYAVREISVDFNREQKYLDNCVTLRFFLGALYLSIVWLALMVAGWDSYVMCICLIFAIVNFINSFKNLLFISFQAHEQMKYQAITYIISSVFTFIFILAAIFLKYGLFEVSLAYLFANLIGLIYTVYTLTKYFVVPKFSLDLKFYKILIIGGIPFALNSLFYFIYYSIDIVMLAQFSNSYSTGLYNASYKLVDALSLFYTIYSSTIFPVMSKLYKNDTSLLRLTFTKSIKYLSFVTIPLAVASLFYGTDVIVLCYGAKYSEAGSILVVLVWPICFLFINGSAVTTLNAAHKERSVTIMYVITAVFNVVLNLFLIPRYDVYGAAFATVLSDILLLIIAMYVLNKIDQLPYVNVLKDILKICIASIIVGILLYITDLHLFLAIPVAIVVYLIIIILIKFFDEEDKNVIKQIVGK